MTSIANKVPTEDQLTYDHETQKERENHNHQLELRKNTICDHKFGNPRQ